MNGRRRAARWRGAIEVPRPGGTEKRRHRGGALTTSPWVRAPLLLLRHPAVFLAIAASTAVLAVAAASGVLFLSTLDTASLQAQAANDCPERSMPGFSSVLPANRVAGARPAGIDAMRRSGALGSPYAVELGFATVQTVPINLYSRAGALDHVQKLTPATGGTGVWIPDNFVQQWNVKPGDYLQTTSGHPIRVAGVYRSLSPNPFALANVPRYFCSWTDLIIRRVVEHGTGPLLISDEQTLGAAADGPVEISWYDPIPLKSISLSQAATANSRGERAEAAFLGQATYATRADPSGATGTDTLGHMIDMARLSKSGVSGSVLPIDLAAVLVASLLVGGAGLFWATHRSREIRLLVARGVGPGALAVKAVLETAPAALLGLGGGFLAAVALVRSVSPTAVLGPGAPANALRAAVAAVAGGLLLIAGIAAFASRDRLIGVRPGRLRWVPWELTLLVVAAVMALRIRATSGIEVDHTIVHVKPVLVIFPLVGSTAVLLLVGRLIALLLPRVRRRVAGGGVGFYLALRRIAGSRAVVIGLIVCTALPGGLLTYTSTLTNSVNHEIAAKYQTNLGAPHVLDVTGVKTADPDLAGQGTAVVAYQSVPHLGDEQVYVLGVDPSTFADFAFTSDAQRRAVSRLRTAPGKATSAILVNAPSGTDASVLRIGSTQLQLEVFARVRVFPGLRAGAFPMVVVDRAALRDVDPNADRNNQVWTSTAHITAARNVIDRAGYSVLDEVTPEVVVGTTGLLPLTWIFSYLRALAIMIGMVAIAGLIFALAARTRRRTVSYVLSRRMGLTKAAHLRSLVIELGIVVGLGWAAGALVGAGAYRLILSALDIYPALPPPAAFQAPFGVWGATGAAWAAVIVVAAVSVHLMAERARPAEILRLE
jgi:putative ABC transport system permease protein